jgi:hypothetical protein
MTWQAQRAKAVEVASEIVRQLGGERALQTMIGARCAASTIDGDPALVFSFKMSRKYNHAQIILQRTDEYEVRLLKIDRFGRESNTKVFKRVPVENIAELFRDETGLEIRVPRFR